MEGESIIRSRSPTYPSPGAPTCRKLDLCFLRTGKVRPSSAASFGLGLVEVHTSSLVPLLCCPPAPPPPPPPPSSTEQTERAPPAPSRAKSSSARYSAAREGFSPPSIASDTRDFRRRSARGRDTSPTRCVLEAPSVSVRAKARYPGNKGDEFCPESYIAPAPLPLFLPFRWHTALPKSGGELLCCFTCFTAFRSAAWPQQRAWFRPTWPGLSRPSSSSSWTRCRRRPPWPPS